jgi:hypothetical protein
MQTNRFLRILLLAIAVAALVIVGVVVAPAWRSDAAGVTERLAAPSFFAAAHTQETAAISALIQDEAGIAAWYNAASPVDLNLVKPVYRVIETQTADYIIGSVPVPDHTEEWHDVHLYVHKDGWFLAYYLKDDPIGKIIDWKHWNSGIPTKLETVLASVSATAGLPTPQSVTHYDFRYPNATKLMFLYEDDTNGHSFHVKAPSSYIYYNRSWSASGSTDFYLDDEKLGGCEGSCWGDISATDFSPDIFHVVSVTGYANDWGVLALLYRDTP